MKSGFAMTLKMEKELKLKIAGIGISIKWEGSRIIDWSHPHYQDFISNGRTSVNLRIHCGNLPEFPFDKMLFDGKEEGNWRLYQSNSRYIIEIYDTMTHKRNKVCLLEPDFSSGDVYIKNSFLSLPSLMQPLSEILLVNLLSKEKGIMVHGLGISEKGKGIAFLGGTGTGKSTLAQFYKREKGVNILSDEHIVIRKEKNEFYLYGTPWPGDAMAVSSRKARLKKIFFIEHSPKNKIFSQGTIADLFPLLFLPFWDKIGMEATLKFCENLLKKIECKKLGFVKDKVAVRFIARM